jgi:hypothetical protein
MNSAGLGASRVTGQCPGATIEEPLNHSRQQDTNGDCSIGQRNPNTTANNNSRWCHVSGRQPRTLGAFKGISMFNPYNNVISPLQESRYRTSAFWFAIGRKTKVGKPCQKNQKNGCDNGSTSVMIWYSEECCRVSWIHRPSWHHCPPPQASRSL